MATVTLPAGFVEQRRGKTLWWLKAGWEDRLLAMIPPHVQEPVQQSAFCNPQSAIPNPQSPIRIRAGRGSVQRIETGSHGVIIVRPYRRGGFVRHFIHDLYWDRPLRPFVELCCTEEAWRRGVPTVEVLGARVEWTMGPLYRGLLVTREATGFHNLWSWLQTAPAADHRRAILRVVAQAVATMHQAGIAHADLNPTNILVYPNSDPPQALIIDFDRARLFSGPVPPHLRESNLRRFQRFFANYDVLAKWLPPAEFEHFLQESRTTLPLKK